MLTLLTAMALLATAAMLMYVAVKAWSIAREVCVVMSVWLVCAALLRISFQLDIIDASQALALGGGIAFGVLPTLIYLVLWRARSF